MAGSRSVGYGAPRGLGPGGPFSRQGRGVEGGMGDVRCYSTFLPYLRRLTLTQPQAHPSLPPRPGPRAGSAARPEPLGRLGVEGEMQGGPIPLPGGAQQRAGLVPWPDLHRAAGKATKSLCTPGPGLGGHPHQPQFPARPSPLPPNNNQRKRKRCHLPMPALRVSKPSGMGGARQLLGAWRGGGLPGGGHGTAYLEPPSLPEQAHRPHTHHHRVS